MARCGCAGSTCNCLITGGEYIAVEGSGTITDPYVISSDGVDISDALQFNDTSTVDFTIVGEGTDSDPWRVSATAKLTVDQLTNVNCASPTNGQTIIWNSTAGEYRCGKPPYTLDELTDVTAPTPAANQVLAWNGTAWVPAPPVTAEPGAIVVGTSMTGDGTTADPLEVNIVTDDIQYQITGKGTDADPLSSTLYVGTDTYGPTVPITSYPVGMARMYVGGGGEAAGWPRNYANVVTVRSTGSNGWQWFYPYGQTQVFLRLWDSTNGWSRWLRVADPRQVQTDCVGAVTVPGKTDGFATATVTFPSGLFTHIPGVFVTLRGGTPNVPITIDNVTASSFQVVIDRPSGDDSDVFWFAASNYTNEE